MTTKTLPFDREKLEEIASVWPTPFYIYDRSAIEANARAFAEAFAWNPGYREYFAVKATPNPEIISLFKPFGFGTDCSSLPELELSAAAGFAGDRIMFTSNDTPAAEFRRAWELGAVVNLDDISHWSFLLDTLGAGTSFAGHTMCCRYNPGSRAVGNDIIGKPLEAKFGMTENQLFECYAAMKRAGVESFGLHAMVASNELDPGAIAATAEMLFTLAGELYAQTGVRVRFVNIGGGVGIPYRPGDKAIDVRDLSDRIRAAYARRIEGGPLAPLALYMECGRCMTGPYGWLVSRVRHVKRTYRNYIGLDASMSNLMRPGMYGAYHHIEMLRRAAGSPAVDVFDVTGSLCENNDKFAVQRELPVPEPGDFAVVYDAGAHGHAMGFQYNGKLRSAELMLEPDGSVREIRRAETLGDYFATLPAEWRSRLGVSGEGKAG